MSRASFSRLIVVLIVLGLMTAPLRAAGEDPLEETKQQRDRRMAWWREARFGLFIHWGLYAVPAGEWRGRRIPGIGEWIMHHAKIPVAEYETLVPKFNPVKFDARQWARIARNAGQKYIVITSKHHDGFCLWDSQLTDYDIMSTPFRRDVLKELARACEAERIRLCFYHSIMDWHHPDQKAQFAKYRQYLFGQVRELLTGYGPIGVMWFDGEWIGPWDRQQGRELARLCRSLQPDGIINNRVGKRHRDDGDFGTPEQTIPAIGIPGHDWETCMTMNNTWGYKHYDHNWKPADDLIRKLVDIASKGGNFLLNVGPTAEGVIPQPSVERLAAMGRWLSVNGESIYGTAASPFRRLPWGRCTSTAGRLYLHVFDWPEGQLELPGLSNKVGRSYLLADAHRASLPVRRDEGRVVIELPAQPPDPIDSVVVLEIEGKASVEPFLIRQSADGSIRLNAIDATIHGQTARYERGGGKDNIGFWTDASDWVSWDFAVTKPGRFDVELAYACANDSAQSSYVVAVGGQELAGTVKQTGSWNTFVKEKLGALRLPEAGKYTLSVRPKTKPHLAVMNLRSVTLRPASP